MLNSAWKTIGIVPLHDILQKYIYVDDGGQDDEINGSN